MTQAVAAPIARLYGEPVLEIPRDLYIPPDALEIILDAFEGPLDLLLYLIRKHNLDVLDIPMADLTKQYMVYVDMMREKHLELAAEYLLMAALLVEIKSRMLLPRPVETLEEEVDPRAELVRRLLEYEQMKLAALGIDQLPQAGRDYHLVQVWVDRQMPARLPNVNADDLKAAWLGLIARARVNRHHKVSREELSVRERMSTILRQLRGRDFVPFETLFNIAGGVPDVVVSFLAILELTKEGMVSIMQQSPFEAIYVRLSQGEVDA